MRYDIDGPIDKDIPLDKYIEQKINMIQNEFHLRISDSEWRALRSAKSKIQADRVARDIFMDRL
jgi:hypothetical protein